MRTAALVAALIGSLVAREAAAQGTDKKIAAEAAFQKGKALMDAGKLDEACAKFEESLKLEAAYGTQYNLALCYDQAGKLASAWANYLEVAARDDNAGRKKKSQLRVDALAPRLTKFRLVVTEPVDGLAITRDDQDVSGLVGVETPIDPGTHAFAASAPGHNGWSGSVDIRGEGKIVEVVVPALDVAVAEVEHPPPDLPVPPPEHHAEPWAANLLTVDPTAGPSHAAIAISLLKLGANYSGTTSIRTDLHAQYLRSGVGGYADFTAVLSAHSDGGQQAAPGNAEVGAILQRPVAGLLVTGHAGVTLPTASESGYTEQAQLYGTSARITDSVRLYPETLYGRIGGSASRTRGAITLRGELALDLGIDRTNANYGAFPHLGRVGFGAAYAQGAFAASVETVDVFALGGTPLWGSSLLVGLQFRVGRTIPFATIGATAVSVGMPGYGEIQATPTVAFFTAALGVAQRF